jgi:hypothetical protein
MKGWCCTAETCWDKQWICSECYSDYIIRRKLDAKTANHYYFTAIGIKNDQDSLDEDSWYGLDNQSKIDQSNTEDSYIDTYV